MNISKDNVKIHEGVNWYLCNGEIDIVILDKEEKNVICLVECKSRIFDIANGYL